MPGAQIDAELGLHVLSDDLDASAVTTIMAGRVTHDDLERGFREVIQDLECSEEEFPVLVVLVSCHAVHVDEKIFPQLIPSDSPIAIGGEVATAAFDIEEHFFNPLKNLRFRSPKAKRLRVVMVFDCCRQDLSNSQDVPRGLRNLLPRLKHDFYIICSCDQGSQSFERAESGGALMSVLLPSLKYAKNICDVFADASCRVTRQRPNEYYRRGNNVPVLGSLPDNPPGWVLSEKDELGDDFRQVSLVVLSGITGHGKSTLGNAITQNESFKVPEVGAGLSSETKSVKHEDIELDAKKYRIIDTPGFNNTHLSMEEIWTRFSGFADLAPAGIDVFLHVVEWGPFTEEKSRALKCLQEIAGEECNEHVLLVFSRAPPDFHRRIVEESERNSNLKEALGTVGSFTAVNCQTLAEMKKAHETITAAVQFLIEKNGKKYSNDLVKIAKTNRIQLVNLMKQLNESDACEVQTLISQVYTGSLSSAKALDLATEKLAQQQSQLQQPQPPSVQVSNSEGAQVTRERLKEAVVRTVPLMRSIGACGQALADAHGGPTGQDFMYGWWGSLGHVESLLSHQHEEKQKEDRLKAMGFSEDRVRSALDEARGDFDAALELLLTEDR